MCSLAGEGAVPSSRRTSRPHTSSHSAFTTCQDSMWGHKLPRLIPAHPSLTWLELVVVLPLPEAVSQQVLCVRRQLLAPEPPPRRLHARHLTGVGRPAAAGAQDVAGHGLHAAPPMAAGRAGGVLPAAAWAVTQVILQQRDLAWDCSCSPLQPAQGLLFLQTTAT